MADLTLNISQYSPLQQFTVRPWETFSPDDQLVITDKINLIIQTLNRLGKLSNDVVTDWNKVMTWVSNDGMTVEVDSQLQKWKDDGTLTTLINAYTGIGDLTTLQTVAKDSLVHAINENVSRLADIATNVKNYGAKGDGVTDDTQAFLNAIQYISTLAINKKVKLYIPAGTYKLTQTLTLNPWMTIQGSGLLNTVLDFSSATSNIVGISLPTTTNYCSLQDFQIVGNQTYVTGIKFDGVSYGTVRRVSTKQCLLGYSFRLTNWMEFYDSLASDCVTGINFSACNHNTFHNFTGTHNSSIANSVMVQQFDQPADITAASGVSTFLKFENCVFHPYDQGTVFDIQDCMNFELQNVHGYVAVYNAVGKTSTFLSFRTQNASMNNVIIRNCNAEQFTKVFDFTNTSGATFQNMEIDHFTCGGIGTFFYNRNASFISTKIHDIWIVDEQNGVTNTRYKIFDIVGMSQFIDCQIYGFQGNTLQTENTLASGYYYLNGGIQSQTKTIYCNYSTGNDNTGNGSSSLPYKTIQRALHAIPKTLHNDITINLQDIGSNYSYIEKSDFPSNPGNFGLHIKGFDGNGKITIVSLAASNSTITLDTNTETVAIYVESDILLEFSNVTINAHNTNAYGMIAKKANGIQFTNCVINTPTSPLAHLYLLSSRILLNNTTFTGTTKNILLYRSSMLVGSGSTTFAGLTFTQKEGIAVINGVIQTI